MVKMGSILFILAFGCAVVVGIWLLSLLPPMLAYTQTPKPIVQRAVLDTAKKVNPKLDSLIREYKPISEENFEELRKMLIAKPVPVEQTLQMIKAPLPDLLKPDSILTPCEITEVRHSPVNVVKKKRHRGWF